MHSLRNNVRDVLQHHDVRDLPSGRAAHRDNRTLHERRCVCGRLWMSWDAGQLIPHALKHHAPSNPSTPTPMPSAGMCPPAGTVKSNDACVAGETCCWAALGRGCVAPMALASRAFLRPGGSDPRSVQTICVNRRPLPSNAVCTVGNCTACAPSSGTTCVACATGYKLVNGQCNQGACALRMGSR